MDNISVACIVVLNNKILIAHRNPVGQMGGRWEFPGGKVECNEDPELTVKREFSEEFGVNAKPLCLITENSFLHNGKNVLLKAYLVEVDSDGIKNPYVLTEHSEYKWVSIDEIPVENFVDSDLKIYPEVKNFVKNQLKAEQ